MCRLDEPDPARAWTERIDQIWQVAQRLDALDLDALHFLGPGTDLTVGLLPSSRFAKEGGASHTRTGVQHVANIPTEEVYTTPDPERTTGVVSATKPLDVAGSLVTGLRIRFEGGRAVRSTPTRTSRCSVPGASSTTARHGWARSRSSTANSRIGKLGRTFFTTLLDENAASHLALGDGYSAPIGDPADLPRINESAVHMDFMIGSDEVEVTGTTKAGETVPVMRGRALADLASSAGSSSASAERLDRVQRVLERVLGDHDLEPVGLVLGLDRGVDARGLEQLLQLLCLGDVTRQRHLHHLRHRRSMIRPARRS